MRLAVYTDYAYHRVDGEIYSERAFSLFIGELATKVERLVVLGRLHPEEHGGHYPLGGADFVPLPYYPSLADPLAAIRGMARSLARFWRALDQVDTVWLLGPHPLAFAFAGLARLRGRRVVLGVRQEFTEYVRSRHPGRRLFAAAADLLELGFRSLARVVPVVVVGPRLAEAYERSPDLLEIVVSLVRPSEVLSSPAAAERDYSGTLTAISVGRLDAEKNPIGLADVARALHEGERDWHLIVCGEGLLHPELEARLDELGVSDRAEIRGYVHHDALNDLYLKSHALLHLSWTEGVPQVLFEAFAVGLPVVATDVGGIRDVTDGAAALIPAGDPVAAAAELDKIAADSRVRESLTEAGLRLARTRSLESEAQRVAGFLARDRATRPQSMLPVS